MASGENEKTMSAELNAQLVEKFLEQVDSLGLKKKRAVQAAIKLYTALPAELQSRLVSGVFDDDPVGGMLNYLLDNEIIRLSKKLQDKLKKANKSEISISDL